MPTYSQKYTKRRRRIPKLDTRPYGTLHMVLMSSEILILLTQMVVLKFFPKELWSTLDPTSAIQNGNLNHIVGKKLQLSKLKRTDGLEGLDGEEGSGNEDGEAGGQDEDADASAEEEILDDEYEEDEDEGGDYNAEQYFDDGGDDAGDDYDGGEAEGGEFY